MKIITTPVLIVGGGLVGLSTSLFLTQQHVSSILVERHFGTSIHPRARGINFRTMELFRGLGLEESLRLAGSDLVNNRGMLIVETLAGVERRRIAMKELQSASLNSISPTGWCMCAQDQSEPVLLEAARQRGGELRFNTELVSFEQDETGVTAIVLDRATGERQAIRADYLVAADGAASPIRDMLDITRSGRGTLGQNISMYFSADLGDLVRGREFILCQVENADVQGLFFAINNKDLWLFGVPYDPEHEKPENFSPERCSDLIRKAVGLSEIAIEIKSVLSWEAAVRVADRFQAGRIFLVGDAAHQMPPTGAFGANTGIQDAHNLAWKLAAVHRGQATPALLATYDAERRPIARFTTEQAGLRSAVSSFESRVAKQEGLADNLVIIAGYQYTSQAVISENDAVMSLEHLALDGHPGRRAPHLWLERQGQRISTLDLFGSRFILLTGENGTGWRDAAQTVATRRQIDLDIYSIGSTGDLIDLEQRWGSAYGVTPEGAVLVRPDGFVAWRAKTVQEPQEQTLERVLDRLL